MTHNFNVNILSTQTKEKIMSEEQNQNTASYADHFHKGEPQTLLKVKIYEGEPLNTDSEEGVILSHDLNTKGHPKDGDVIVHTAENADLKWLVSKDDFKKNYQTKPVENVE